MAASFVQSKGVQTNSGTQASVSLTGVGAGNHLNTIVVSGGVTTVTTSTPSNSWSTARGDVLLGPYHFRSDYLENVASGSWTINGNGSSGIDCMASESAGVKTSASLGNNNAGSSAASTVQPGSINVTSGSIVYAGVGQNGSGTGASTIDSSFVVDQAGGAGTVWDNNAGNAGGSAHKTSPNSTENPTWTSGSAGTNSMGALIVEYLAAAAAPPADAAPFVQKRGRDPWNPARAWMALRAVLRYAAT